MILLPLEVNPQVMLMLSVQESIRTQQTFQAQINALDREIERRITLSKPVDHLVKSKLSLVSILSRLK